MGVAVPLWLALTAVGQTGALYDAEAHRLQASGAAAADLRAPTAAIARVKAERSARAQAEKRLQAALEALGAKLSDERLGKLLQSAEIADEQYGSDGSVELKLILSTKALDLKR